MAFSKETRKKKFEDMSREELLSTRDTLKHQLNDVNADIGNMKASLKEKGKPPTLSGKTRAECQKANLCWMLSRIEKELKGTRPSKNEQDELESEVFQRTAKTLLEPGLYQMLLENTREAMLSR